MLKEKAIQIFEGFGYEENIFLCLERYFNLLNFGYSIENSEYFKLLERHYDFNLSLMFIKFPEEKLKQKEIHEAARNKIIFYKSLTSDTLSYYLNDLLYNVLILKNDFILEKENIFNKIKSILNILNTFSKFNYKQNNNQSCKTVSKIDSLLLKLSNKSKSFLGEEKLNKIKNLESQISNTTYLKSTNQIDKFSDTELHLIKFRRKIYKFMEIISTIYIVKLYELNLDNKNLLRVSNLVIKNIKNNIGVNL